ncbi:MAG TPA: DUF1134 domain-containing protein [Burkholderiales bacterium]|nr:DUF1134 domain-containing protein [Burkholderiales bacterium]
MLKDRISLCLVAAAAGLLFTVTASAAVEQKNKEQSSNETYDEDTVIGEVTGYFGKGAEGIAKVVEKAFKDHGRPNGYIKGEEASGAFFVGLRYGDGTLTLKNKGSYKVNWQGPSVGFDVGGDASKVFVLVYNLQNPDDLYQRFPAVDGSLYFVAGTSLNYHQSDDIILAPIRLGVGLRFGINVGYMHYTRSMSWNPL